MLSSKPKISVVTICYNSAATIEKTIKSVVQQAYGNLEYVIIDGASTDDTLNIVNAYRSHIHVLVSEKDNGISDAFNKGIARSTGDLIVFLNSDDYFLPGALEAVAAAYRPGQDDIVCGNVLLRNTQTGYECREVPSTDFPVMPFFRHVAHQGMFVTKSAYERFGTYDVSIKNPMDLDFLMRATRLGAKFHRIDADVAVFNSGGATAKSIFKKKADYLRIVRKNGGNALQAYTFYYFLVATQIAKKILNIFGSNFSQKLRYRTKLKK